MLSLRHFTWLALAASLGAVACGGDSSTGPISQVSGTYDLRTVNGSALPFTTYQSANERDELLSDVITASGGSFTELSTYRVTFNGQVSSGTQADAGAYVVNGTAVSFVFNSGSSGTGTISGNSFIVADAGVSSYYVHR